MTPFAYETQYSALRRKKRERYELGSTDRSDGPYKAISPLKGEPSGKINFHNKTKISEKDFL